MKGIQLGRKLAVAFAAIFMTQNPSNSGNQIIQLLDDAGIKTNWTGSNEIEKMADFFGWRSQTKDSDGRDLILSGTSNKRFESLLKNIKNDWIPLLLMQTDGGFIGNSGGTRHWVGVVGIGVHNNERFVYVYNPVIDKPTRYSWEVLYSSLSIKYTVKDKKTGKEYIMDHNGLVLIRPPRIQIIKNGTVPE